MDAVALIRDFLRDSPDPVAAFDAAGDCLFANPAMDRTGLCGILRAHMAGADGPRLIALGLGRAKPLPFRFDKDGQVLRGTIRRIVAADADRAVLVQLTQSDKMASLTAHKRQETLSLQQRDDSLRLLARFEAFFHNAHDGIGVLDSAGIVTRTNRAFKDIFADSGQSVLGARFDDLFRPTGFTGPILDPKGAGGLRDPAATVPFEAVLQGAVAPRYFEITLTETSLAGSLEFLVVLRDLTTSQRLADLDNLNEELRAAQRTRDEFIHLIAHEMRAPLAAVVSAAENLRARADGPTDTIHRNAQVVEDAATEALTQFSAILAMTRGTGAAGEMLQPAQLVARLMRQHGPVADRLQVDLQGAIAGVAPVDVPVDPGRTFLILTNLLSNALKHCGEGDRVRFSLRTDTLAQVVEFTVSDTGTGIPYDRQPAIFEAFETGADRMDMLGGLGVGLALVRSAVRDMGGRIRLDSAPGHGTTFYVRLPFARMPAQVATPASDDPLPVIALQAGDLVLVVDDDPVTRALLVARLHDKGLKIAEAANGADAVQHIQGGTMPALVMMDRHMPVMDGATATAAIRAMACARQPIIVGLTAFVDDAALRDLQKAGFDRVVQKPLTDQGLAALIRVTAAPAADHQPAADLHLLPGLIATRSWPDAAKLAAAEAARLSRIGARDDSLFLRALALRLMDGLAPDQQDAARLDQLCAPAELPR
jgi:signal transduction histidine kinase/CheY-like chemotaxis protein